MEQGEVPQDRAKAYMGLRKALYATDEQGRYRLVTSSGWEAEEIVLDQAIEEYQRAAADAWRRARAGQGSALEYHMCRQRMDPTLLAQSTGFWRWSVTRHLKPGAYARLSRAKKLRYADALGLPVEELERLPDAP